VKVRAMNMVPIRPPRPSRSEVNRARPLGNSISYMPKRLSAKNTNSPPMMQFMIGSVLRARKTDSRATAEMVSTTTMVGQYTVAMVSGRWCWLSDCFRKKLTVIGIIGKTHGVISDTAPQKTPARMNAHNPDPAEAVTDAPLASPPGDTTWIGGGPDLSRAC